MKAIMKTRPAPGAELRNIPIPEIKEDELLVKLRASALCGSDKDVYEYTPSVAAQNLPMPFVMGHELFGEVIETGQNVTGFLSGDMVASDSHMPCLSCYLCNTGKRHLCMKRGVLGRRKDGCFAEYMALPAVAAVKMAPNMKPEHGPLLEPLGVAIHAAQRVNLSGCSVLVTGLGTIGMMQVDVARLMGANRIIACSTSDEKLRTACRYGANHGVNSRKTDVLDEVMRLTGGNGVDVVFEMSGALHLYNLGIDCLSKGGTLVSVGLFNEPVVIEDYNSRVIRSERTLTSVFGRLMFETWAVTKEFLSLGRIDLDRYIGAVLPLEEFGHGVELSKKVLGRIIYKP
ncbi:MAG: alcohol dehydrogenase catalytic domain-containing protein [Oscillospiraceae bacterium]